MNHSVKAGHTRLNISHWVQDAIMLKAFIKNYMDELAISIAVAAAILIPLLLGFAQMA